MGRVIHFEIQADDPERAAEFYQQAFGWAIQNWGGPVDYWLATTGPDEEPGINGTITRRMNPGTVNTIDVASFDEAAQKIVEAGGKVTTPKRAVPGIGWMTYCKDTKGNTFGIMQNDLSAD